MCVTKARFMSAFIFKECKSRWKTEAGCEQALRELGSFCLKDVKYLSPVEMWRAVSAVNWFEWCAQVINNYNCYNAEQIIALLVF